MGTAWRRVRGWLAEAARALLRGWRTALLSLATIVAAVFVLGVALVGSAAVERVLAHWAQAAELSVFLAPGASAAERAAVEDALRRAEVVAGVTYVDEAEARARFGRAFPDLAALTTDPAAPRLPPSLEARLRPGAHDTAALPDLAVRLAAMPGVGDVRYDRGAIARLAATAATARRIALALAVLLSLAAALAVLSVVRLSYVARLEEVEILTLVGAPHATIRGPFVAEGWLQGTLGAALALLALAGGVAWVRVHYGPALAAAIGIDAIAFLPARTWVALLLGAGLLGALAGGAAVQRRGTVR
jgi:cell division transport system permease protein